MGHLSTSDRVSTTTITPSSGETSADSSSDNEFKVVKRINAANAANNGELPNGKNDLSLASKDAFSDAKNGNILSDPTQTRPMFMPAAGIDLEEYERNFKGDKVFGIQFKAPLKWDKVIQISLLHIIAILCLIFFPIGKLSLKSTIFSFFMGGVAGFGVTAGAHRYWTHKSYKASLPLRIILMLCFSIAGQNTMYDWVRDHRVHHKYSETDADPHNSNRGFFFAHVGWLMMLKHPEVMRRGRQIDMTDVSSDPVIQFHQKYFIFLKMVLCFIIPIAIPIYFWGEEWHLALITQGIFRYVSSLNFTWLVNSAAHMWGTRPFDKRINPSENIYVSILAMGEGWHNYHHVFPWDYKAAELGKYTVNCTTMFLDMFAKIGWAWDMKQPSKELVRRTLEKYGDGTHESLQHQSEYDHGHGHCHLPEVPYPEDDDAESSSTESTKLDENDNITKPMAT